MTFNNRFLTAFPMKLKFFYPHPAHFYVSGMVPCLQEFESNAVYFYHLSQMLQLLFINSSCFHCYSNYICFKAVVLKYFGSANPLTTLYKLENPHSPPTVGAAGNLNEWDTLHWIWKRTA